MITNDFAGFEGNMKDVRIVYGCKYLVTKRVQSSYHSIRKAYSIQRTASEEASIKIKNSKLRNKALKRT